MTASAPNLDLGRRNGLGYEALTAMMALLTSYIGQAYGSQATEAVQRIAGLGFGVAIARRLAALAPPGNRPEAVSATQARSLC